MKIAYFYIEERLCINCAACVLICKKCFTIKNNKVVALKTHTNSEKEIEDLKLAADVCPTRAIFLDIVSDEEEILKSNK